MFPYDDGPLELGIMLEKSSWNGGMCLSLLWRVPRWLNPSLNQNRLIGLSREFIVNLIAKTSPIRDHIILMSWVKTGNTTHSF